MFLWVSQIISSEFAKLLKEIDEFLKGIYAKEIHKAASRAASQPWQPAGGAASQQAEKNKIP